MNIENLIDWFIQNDYATRKATGKTWKEIGKMFNCTPFSAKSKFYRWKQKNDLELIKEVYKNDELLFSTFKKQTKTKELDLTSFDIKKVSESNQGVQWITYENNEKEISSDYVQQVLNSLEYPDITVDYHDNNLTGFKMINFTDVHIGMSADGVFNTAYDKEEILRRFVKMIPYCKSDLLVINMLGDYTDGLSKQTNRKKHVLPQNLSNEEMFKYGLDYALLLIINVRKAANNIVINWLTDSNHSPFIDYTIGYSIEQMFKNDPSISFNLVTKFIDTQSFTIDDKKYDFILTHGYDKNLMMKPLPRVLSVSDIGFIKKIIDVNKLGDKVFLLRGDQHRYHDISYDSFRDIMTPSLAPPSGWAQINFGTDYNGGFTIISIDNNNVFSKLIEF